jgi:hypothetical protein
MSADPGEERNVRDRLTEIVDRLDRLPDVPVPTVAGMRIMVVTTTITAMNYGTFVVGGGGTNGQAVDAVFDVSGPTLVAGDGDPEDVYNYHEKTFRAGAFIAVMQSQGANFVFDVDQCGNYV